MGFWGSVFAAARMGKTLVYAEGPSLYQYTFETQELTEITPAMSETVYFEGQSGTAAAETIWPFSEAWTGRKIPQPTARLA